jgi:DNA-binding MarR family transcriptional regulator
VNTADLGNDLLRGAARLNRWASRNAWLDVPSASARWLALLEESGPTRVGDLALADHSSQPTATAAIGRLVAAGWVERAGDPADARASLVLLSPSGKAALERARAARAAALEPVLEELARRDPDSLTRVGAAVRVIAELLEIAAAATSSPTT